MPFQTHPRIDALLGLAGLLEEAARELALRTRRFATEGKRRRRNATMRPGTGTPLWNVLVAMAKPHLSRRGSRALLARELGLHRARIGEFFDTRTAMPDAERTLRLLVWLAPGAGAGTGPTAKRRKSRNKCS